MDIASIIHLFVVVSIPLVGSAFLYCELRWNMFAEKSVAYGFMYAIFALILLLAVEWPGCWGYGLGGPQTGHMSAMEFSCGATD